MPAPRDLSTLAATVAHELLTPLTIIASATSLLEREVADGRTRDQLDEILDTIRRNVAVAQVVVDALRSLDDEGADLELQRTAVPLGALARSTVEDLRPTILRRHPTDVVGDDVELVADADPVRVRQVLFNLLGNAAKFSPAGRPVVVELRPRGDEAEIVVRDRGHGVAPDDAERIFEKWERADEDTPGLGLGLHLSRAIARAHGGDLRLDPAAADDGAVFVLTLPRRRVSDREGNGDGRR